MAITEIAGFAGAGLAGAAYVPQIAHLIRARCAAGLSRLAFAAWLLASVLITARALAIHAGVFIAAGATQTAATALIMAYAARYKDTPCPGHLPRHPTANTATRTAAAGDEPGSAAGMIADAGDLSLRSGVLPAAWHERMPSSAARTPQFIPSAGYRNFE